MFYIINDELFTFEATEGTNDYGDFYQLNILTSNNVRKKSEDGTSDVWLPKTITRVYGPDKDFSQYKMAYSSKENDHGKVNVVIKFNQSVKVDNSLYIVAIPFNGVIKPIPASNQYRILKGYIAVSDNWSIEYGPRKYKKILYLIISPNPGVFINNPENKIIINFESFSNTVDNKKSDNPIKKTQHEIMSLIISEKDYSLNHNIEKIDYVDTESFKSTPMYTTFKSPKAVAVVNEVVENNTSSEERIVATSETSPEEAKKMTEMSASKMADTTNGNTSHTNSKPHNGNRHGNGYNGKNKSKNHNDYDDDGGYASNNKKRK